MKIKFFAYIFLTCILFYVNNLNAQKRKLAQFRELNNIYIQLDSTTTLIKIDNIFDTVCLIKFCEKSDSLVGLYYETHSYNDSIIIKKFRNNKIFESIYFDEKGHTLYSQYILDRNKILKNYYSHRGKRLTEIIENKDGVVIEFNYYYKNGKLWFSRIYNENGIILKEVYYRRNSSIELVITYIDGITSKINYYNKYGKLK